MVSICSESSTDARNFWCKPCMNIIETKLAGVLILEPTVFRDNRGYFMEMYNGSRYQAAGLPEKFVQDNLSLSAKNIVRGLHYQIKNPQGKLVSVLRGKVFDVVVDLRQGSATFGQWLSVELSSDNNKQIYIPPGLAHGFCALSDEVLFHYKCTDYYNPQDEAGVQWSDSDLAIDWPLKDAASLSAKDAALPLLKDISSQKLPEYGL